MSKRKPKPDPLPLPHNFICDACARARGGKWPSGHVATCHERECPYCGARAYLANIGDWSWPDGTARGMRD